MKKFAHIVPLAAARNKDLAVVGGKNASLGELIGELAAAGVRVPDGFATTADAYRAFLRAADLRDLIDRKLESADIDSPDDLARAAAAIRDGILAASLPADLDSEIRAAYRLLDDGAGGECAVAVRSSATAEDLAGSVFRRPAGHFFECARRGRSCRRRQARFRLALHRARNRLPRPPRL